MPTYIPGNGDPGHMVLGKGPKGYLITLIQPDHGALMIEVWARGMIEAIAHVEEVSVGEVVSCLKLWAL